MSLKIVSIMKRPRILWKIFLDVTHVGYVEKVHNRYYLSFNSKMYNMRVRKTRKEAAEACLLNDLP